METISYRSAFAGSAFLLAMIFSTTNGYADEEFKANVAVADLNLQTDQGVKMLHDRIAAAAVRVCGQPDGRTLADMTNVWECRQAAIAKATPHADALVAAAENGGSYVASLPAKGSSPTSKTAQ